MHHASCMLTTAVVQRLSCQWKGQIRTTLDNSYSIDLTVSRSFQSLNAKCFNFLAKVFFSDSERSTRQQYK